MKRGIDVAKWNRITDYHAVKAAGVDFAIVKVINAKNEADGLFYRHMEGFRQAGIPVIGGYTYTYANTVAKASVASAAFVKRASAEGIDFMWLDIEDKVMMNLGPVLVDIINVYREAARSAGMGFGIYTGVYFFNTYIKKYISKLPGVRFWFARYPYSDKKFTMSDEAPAAKNMPANVDIDGWQFSSKGIVPGITGYVDMNIWYETEPFATSQEIEITTDVNPFEEPSTVIKLGSSGEGAKWVQWYLWRFGLLLTDGVPDISKITGYIDVESSNAIGESQVRLGLTGNKVDKKVGKETRSLYKKVA